MTSSGRILTIVGAQSCSVHGGWRRRCSTCVGRAQGSLIGGIKVRGRLLCREALI
jgi:hypothetical protein